MPGIDVGNVFGQVLRSPLTAAGNWFGGGLSRVAESGNGDDPSYQFLADTMRTGQPVTEEPRTGLLSFVSPTMKADPRTQYLEQVLLHQKAADEFKTKIGAIGVFEDLVNQIGGDKAIKMAPAVFGDILKDPDILQAFAGVHAKGNAEQQRYLDQAALQEQGFQNRLRLLDYEQEHGVGPYKQPAGKESLADKEELKAYGDILGSFKNPLTGEVDRNKQAKFLDIYAKTHSISEALRAIADQPPSAAEPGFWARLFGGGTRPLGTGTAEAEPSAQPQPSAEATPNLGF